MFGSKKYWYMYCKWITVNPKFKHGNWYVFKFDKPYTKTKMDGKYATIIETSNGNLHRGEKFTVDISRMYDVKLYQTADELMADKFVELLGEDAQPPKPS